MQGKYQQIIQKIILDQSDKSINFENKQYYIQYFQSIIDQFIIEKLQKLFKKKENEEKNILEFVRIFFDLFQFDKEDCFFQTICIITVFQEIVSQKRNKDTVNYRDFIDYITENFINDGNGMEDGVIREQLIPQKQIFKIDKEEVRDIDIDTANFYNYSDEQLRRINKNKIITDCQHRGDNYIKRGFYSDDCKRIFTLESLSNKIQIFDLKCKLIKDLKPKSHNKIKLNNETIIISFFWSNRQQRMGACLNDISLIFWDLSDNFSFEKRLNVQTLCFEQQTVIWYIDFMDIWITTDKTHTLYGWDIVNDRIKFQLNKIKVEIYDIIELPQLKKVAIACQDNTIQIFNLVTQLKFMSIHITKGGLHSLKFFESFQTLLTIGYDNTVSVIKIKLQQQEFSILGQLIGHQGLITALQCIEQTPMVITIDDQYTIKVWDIRKLTCIQSVVLQSKFKVIKIVNLHQKSKIAFVGTRLFMMEWDTPLPKLQEFKDFHPIKVEFNEQMQQMIMCSTKEVRKIQIWDGRVIRVYAGLLTQQNDEIVNFITINYQEQFIVTDQRGTLRVFDFASGEMLGQYRNHQNEITQLLFDHQNNLIISSAFDQKFSVQKYTNKNHTIKIQILRELTNCYPKNGIQLLQYSLKYNILIVGSQHSSIFIYNYEYMKLIGTIKLENDNEHPTCIYIFEDYQVIALTTTFMHLNLIGFKFDSSNKNLIFTQLHSVKLDCNDDEFYDKNQSYIVNQMICDIQIKPKQQEVNMYLGTISGLVVVYDFAEIFMNLEKVEKNLEIFYNFNPYRKAKGDFQEINIAQLVPEIKCQNYQSMKRFTTLIFQAHKQEMTEMKFVKIDQRKIITLSFDQLIKIWDLKGIQEARLNINQPLPQLWNLKANYIIQVGKMIVYTLKVIDSLKKLKNLNTNESKYVNEINNYIESIETQSDDNCFATEINYVKEKKPQLMKNQYSDKDIQFEKFKNILQKEVIGPTLKDIEINKNQKNLSNQLQQEAQKNKIQLRILPPPENLDYFYPNYRDQLASESYEVEKNKPQLAKKTLEFQDRFDNKFSAEKQNFNQILQMHVDPRLQSAMNKNKTFLQKEFKYKSNDKLDFQNKTYQENNSFFERAKQRQLTVDGKLEESLKSVQNQTYVQKKLVGVILKNLDHKIKYSQTKFKNQPMEYFNLGDQSTNFNSQINNSISKQPSNKKLLKNSSVNQQQYAETSIEILIKQYKMQNIQQNKIQKIKEK